MRVMITGHLGYIGPVLIRLLRAHGHQTIGFDSGFFAECLDQWSTDERPDSEIRKDIRDIDASDFDRIDAVVHLAALSNDPLGEIVAAQTHDINSLGTERCAAMAKRAGVRRFIFSSSCSIYGAAGGAAKPLDEGAPFAPVSAYGKSKAFGEGALETLRDEKFMPIFLRNATCYGVSPRMRLDLVVGNLMAFGHATGSIRVMSDGTPWRPLVHIEDVARAAVAAIEADAKDLAHTIFNIGRSDANYQVKDIAQMVADLLTGCAIEITGETGGDPRSYRVDFSRAARDLPGFKPVWTLERGVAELAEWLKLRPKSREALFSSTYIRLEHMKSLRKRELLDDAFRWTRAAAE
ncbi:MAG: NAD-dependent epimerase/dehydratase family protein [Alphaproteobacteria bacterium]|nr:NAD-dependent epimerase/dehydratase family protein [Alphaproteobacteria bacterium]